MHCALRNHPSMGPLLIYAAWGWPTLNAFGSGTLLLDLLLGNTHQIVWVSNRRSYLATLSLSGRWHQPQCGRSGGLHQVGVWKLRGC